MSTLAGRPTGLTDLLDDLPQGPLHRRITAVLGAVFFFELADLNTFAYTAPALKEHEHFTLDDIGHVTSASFVGMALGALVGGWLADRFGRRGSLLLSTVWFSLFSLATAFVSSPTAFMVLRALTGAGLSAMTVIAIVYISETMAPRFRGAAQAATLIIGLFGIPVASFVARAVIPMGEHAWRYVFVFGALGFLLAPAIRMLPETPRWLIAHDRMGPAHEVAGRLGVPQERIDAAVATLGEEQFALRQRDDHSVADLFRGGMARRTLVAVVLYAFSMLGFYAFASWVPSLLTEQGFSLTKSLTFSAVTTLGAPVGAIIGRTVTERFSRKWLMLAFGVIIAACGVAYGVSRSDTPILVFGFCVAALSQTFVTFLYAYTPEIFPTGIRSFGSGVAYSAGRVSNIIGPLIIPAIFHARGYTWVFLFIAAAWLVAGITVAAFGPETRNVKLEELERQA